MSRVQPGWERRPFFEANGQGALNRACVFFAAEREIFKGGCASEEQRPVDSFNGSFNLIGTLASRIQASHQTTHTVPGDVVNGNVVLLKPSEHTDVGQSQRTTAFERNSDCHPLGRSREAALGNSTK